MTIAAALQTAYASVSETPLYTVRLFHTSLTAGELNLVQAKHDLTATLEDATVVTFDKAGLDLDLLKKGVDGKQDLAIAMSNVSRTAWGELKAIIQTNRASALAGTTVEAIRLELRAFLPSDLSQPASPTVNLIVVDSQVDLMTVKLRAAYMPIVDISWPKARYYAELFPGVKYA